MNRKILTIISIALVLAIGGIWYTISKEPANNDPIKIGWIGPLTGDAATMGEPVKKVTALAVEEINNKGGISGRKIEIIYEDGKCNGKDSVSAAQKLINVDEVKIIIGGMCSGETLAIAPIAEAAKVILLSPASSNPDITDSGDYIFRNFPSDSTTGRKMAEVATERRFKKIALLTETTSYVEGLRKVFLSRLSELGGSMVSDEKFSSQTKDIRTQIAKVKNSNPDTIYVITQSAGTMEMAMRQLKEAGWQKQILANEMINTDIVLKNIPKLIEGVLYAEAKFDDKAPASDTLLRKYQAKYGDLGGGLPPIYLGSAYDAVNILKEQIEKYGENPDKIKAGLYQIKDREGAAGKLTIDQNGDALMEYVVKTIKNGKPELVEG